MEPILRIKNIEKYYGNKSCLTKAIDDISFTVDEGEFVAIMGASGSGKTTLLNCISTIDKVTAGNIYLEDTDVTALKGKELNKFRRDKLGFIFQDFNLLDNFTIEDNIKLPLVLAGEDHRTMDDKVAPLVKELGIADLIHKYPYEVSGGQKQRTAVARALITKPQILLADEPTGALDSKAATNLMHQLRDIHKSGQTILMVTHSNVAASYADRVMFIRDGEVFHQIYRGNLKRSEMLDKICDAVTVLMRGGEDSE